VPVFERHTLSNGLRVLTAPLPHAQSVACFVMLAAGSRYESAENRGIAHFAEHMFFKGTERRPTSRDLTTLIDGIGGEFNAFTSKEYTGYYVRCAGAERDMAFDVLLDMLRHSKFDPDEIEREKGVILEEMNMYQDTPRDQIGNVYETLIFGDNQLGWEVLGTKETIRGASRKTFTDYIDEWYTPDRMVIGVSGKIGKNLLPMLEKLVGDMASGKPRKPRKPKLARTPGPHVAVHYKSADQAHLILGVPSFPLEHPDRYALQLLSAVLGSGMSSRLFLEVRERRGLAYYVHGMNHSYTDAGSLLAQAGVDIKRIDEAIEVIVEQFVRMAEERVPDDEFEKARAMIKGRFVLRTEAPQGLLMYGLNREILEGEALEPEELLKQIDAVTAKDVQRVARRLISKEKLHLAVVGPFKNPERFRKLLAGETKARIAKTASKAPAPPAAVAKPPVQAKSAVKAKPAAKATPAMKAAVARTPVKATAKSAAKPASKTAAMPASKTAAKTPAKTAAKTASKSTAKAPAKKAAAKAASTTPLAPGTSLSRRRG
jgi:predicted Zn-dependent peptidase